MDSTNEKHKIEKGNQVRVLFSVEPSNIGTYKVVAGDELTLEFPEDMESAFQVFVGADGKITLPRVGKSIKAAGLTIAELNKTTTKEYKDLYVTPKPSWAIARDYTVRVNGLAGDFSVSYDGEIVIPTIGRFHVLGKNSDEVAQLLTTEASHYFSNRVTASVSVAKVNTREQVDNRLSPSGLEISMNLSNAPSRVSEDGSVYVPKVGNINVLGKTVTAFKDEITPLIQAQYQNPVSVNVSVQEYADNSIFIGGEVRQPGRYSYANKLSLLKLIAVAGWGNEYADLANVMLLRATGDHAYTIYRTNLDEVIDGKVSGAQDFKITPQDLVIVPPTGIAKANRYIAQYIRGILPFGTNVSYNFNNPNNNNNR
jgi:protein involved in polysaccharide export with SLBB domain